MRSYNLYQKYIDAQEDFKDSFENNISDCKDARECNWSLFKESFLKFTKAKCPICEDTLNRYDDIDHFRPKADYPFLKCCCKNYMIMCSDCNRAHKGSNFPLKTNYVASNETELVNEKRLLINPREDDIYEYFKLLFKRTSNNKLVLEIAPKDGLSEEKQDIAEKTIEIYGIGNCENNPKIDICRINILENHYEMFFDFAQALERGEETFENLLLQRSMRKKKEYGFIKFLEKNQFSIAI